VYIYIRLSSNHNSGAYRSAGHLQFRFVSFRWDWDGYWYWYWDDYDHDDDDDDDGALLGGVTSSSSSSSWRSRSLGPYGIAFVDCRRP